MNEMQKYDCKNEKGHKKTCPALLGEITDELT